MNIRECKGETLRACLRGRAIDAKTAGCKVVIQQCNREDTFSAYTG